MKKPTILIALFFICTFAFAQNSIRTNPRVIHVGDSAALIVSLPGASRNMDDIVLLPHSPSFPADKDIDFHKIILERRPGVSSLIIEFTAFVPGYLVFPDIAIGGEIFSGLSVTISSVLIPGIPLELARPASSLAVPGTAIILFGIMAGIVFAILFVIWFSLKGRKYLQKWTVILKRRMIFFSFNKKRKQLARMLSKGGDKRLILDKLSEQFREFLTFLTCKNCRAMTAGEFEMMSEPEMAALGDFFRRCDTLRFSGDYIKPELVLVLLDDMRVFAEKSEKREAA